MINTTNINSIWSSLIIEELIRYGINYFCISPGSRSTPLTLAAAENTNAETIICLDERNAAFHALGYARSSGKPACLICTSGTAGANYYPAVIEASEDRLPMIVITADRPPELHNIGANQTTNQVEMFGKHVKAFSNIDCPDENISPESLLTTIDNIVFKSLYNSSGPVHLNCQFREPLYREKQKISSGYMSSIKNWIKSDQPFTSCKPAFPAVTESELKKLVGRLKSKKILVVIGRLHSFTEKKKLLELIKTMNMPVFADISSGLRQVDINNSIGHYDLLLNSIDFRKSLDPDVILHIGGQLVSKIYLEFITECKFDEYIHIADHSDRIDPGNVVTKRYTTDIDDLCVKLLGTTGKNNENKPSANLYKYNDLCSNYISSELSSSNLMTEPYIAKTVSELTPAGHIIFPGNSMPVRDFDMFTGALKQGVDICVNRGTSGIDGNIASAAGLASGKGKPVTVVIGDLAFFHNMNALELLGKIKEKITIVVINNNGGGIFSFLPAAKENPHFEKYFGTPHGLTFEKAAGMFDIKYSNPGTNRDFEQAYKKAVKSKDHTIIEVITDRQHNYKYHKSLINGLDKFLKKSSN